MATMASVAASAAKLISSVPSRAAVTRSAVVTLFPNRPLEVGVPVRFPRYMKDVVAELKALSASPRVIVLVGPGAPDSVAAVLSAGADGLLVRSTYTDAMGQEVKTTSVRLPGTCPDGSSNTLLVGERYMNPTWYTIGSGPESDEYRGGYITGMPGRLRFLVRSGAFEPAKDRTYLGPEDYSRFGSAHPNGFHGVFGDGAIHTIRYYARCWRRRVKVTVLPASPTIPLGSTARKRCVRSSALWGMAI